jgi:hypothetical protein
MAVAVEISEGEEENYDVISNHWWSDRVQYTGTYSGYKSPIVPIP